MRGAIFVLPNTPSWRGAEFKHRVYFTLLLLQTYDKLTDMHKFHTEINNGFKNKNFKIQAGILAFLKSF
jgi:hypothetical protein